MKNKTISNFQWTVFAEDWGRHPSSTQHLFKYLNRTDSVLWVNSIGLRRPRISDLTRIKEKIAQIFNPTHNDFQQKISNVKKENQHTNLDVLAPIAIPWPGNAVFYVINRALLSVQLRLSAKCKDYNSVNVLWMSLPTARCVIANSCNEDIVVYYAGDDFGSLAGVDNVAVTKEETLLVAKADIIFTASKKLANKFPAHKTYLLSHGVDLALFSKQCSKPSDLPDHQFVVGFYGSISSWLDQELLNYLATERPDIGFVLIGHVEIPTPRFFALPNVYHLASVPHEQLVEYASNWDVSILPFVSNEQIDACNPLKLREYLAVGKPVLSTIFPAMKEYENTVFSGASNIDLLQQLDKILLLSPEDKQEIETKSRHAVEHLSWEGIAESAKQILLEAVNNKQLRNPNE